MIGCNDKAEALELIRGAVADGARKSKACEVLEISLRSCQRWEKDRSPDRRKGAAKHVRKLSSEERQAVLDISCHERFKDLTPHEIVPVWQKSRYLASESTFYRVLREMEMVNHRRNSKPKSKAETA